MREWDPIGVAGAKEVQDEYDAYVAKAYVMLMDDQATAEEIAAYLLGIATICMGLSETPAEVESSKRTARMLVAMRPEFERH